LRAKARIGTVLGCELSVQRPDVGNVVEVVEAGGLGRHEEPR
jgi:hypothetical protein